MAHPHRFALWLFLALSFAFILSGSGHFYSSDGEQKLSVLTAIVEHRTVFITDGWSVTDDGRRAAWFPLGASLWMLPGYGLAQCFASWLPPDQLPMLTKALVAGQNAIISAALLTTLWGYLYWRGHSQTLAVLTTLVAGFGTMIWPYAKTDWSEPGATWLLLMALWALEAAFSSERRARWHSLCGGTLLAMAVSIRQELALVIPGALAWWLWHPRRSHMPNAAMLMILAVPLLAATTLALWYNAARYGSCWHFANFQGVQSHLTLPTGGRLAWALGNAYHYTINPGDGLFWYAPPLLLALWKIPEWWRHERLSASLYGLTMLPLLAFYTGVWGLSDWAWGPRYAYVFIPVLAIPMARALRDWQRAKVLVVTLVLWGVMVQVIANCHNFNFLFEREMARHPGLTTQQLMSQPQHAPWRLALVATYDAICEPSALSAPPALAQRMAPQRAMAYGLPDFWFCLTPLFIPFRYVALALATILAAWLFCIWQCLRHIDIIQHSQANAPRA